jgi:hypothetical protein
LVKQGAQGSPWRLGEKGPLGKVGKVFDALGKVKQDQKIDF